MESNNGNNDLEKDLEKYDSTNDTDYAYLHQNPTPNVTDIYSLHHFPNTIGNQTIVATNASINDITSLPDVDNTLTSQYYGESNNNDNTNITLPPIDLTNQQDSANLTIAVDNENFINNNNNNSIAIGKTNNNVDFTNTASSPYYTRYGEPARQVNLYDVKTAYDQEPNIYNSSIHDVEAFNNGAGKGNSDKTIPLNEINNLLKEKNETTKVKSKGTEKINLDVKVYSSGVTNIYVDQKGNVAVSRTDGKNTSAVKNKPNTETPKPTKTPKASKMKSELDEDIMEDESEHVFVDSKAYTEENEEYIPDVNKKTETTEHEKDKDSFNLNQTSFESAKVGGQVMNELDNDTENTFVDSESDGSSKPQTDWVKYGLSDNNVVKDKTHNTTRTNLKPYAAVNEAINLINLKVKSANLTNDKMKDYKNMSKINNSNLTANRIGLNNGAPKPPHAITNKNNASNIHLKVNNANNKKYNEKNASHSSDTKSIEEIDDIAGHIIKKIDKVNSESDARLKNKTNKVEASNIKQGVNVKYAPTAITNDSANEVSRSALKIVEDLVDIINTTHNKNTKNDTLKGSNTKENNDTSSKNHESPKRRHFDLGGINFAPFDQDNEIDPKGGEITDTDSTNAIKDKKKLHILEITSMIVSGMKKQRVANKKAHRLTPATGSKRHLSRRQKKRERLSPSSSVSIVKRDAYEQSNFQGNDFPGENVLIKNNEIHPRYKEKEIDIELPIDKSNHLEKDSVDASNLIPPEYVEVETEKILPQTNQKQLAESVKRTTIPTRYPDEPPQEIALVRTSDTAPSFIAEPIEQVLPEATQSQPLDAIKKDKIPPEYMSDQDITLHKSAPQPMLAALEKRSTISSELKLEETDKVFEQQMRTNTEKHNYTPPQYIDKRDKIWTDDQDDSGNEENNMIDNNQDTNTPERSPDEESIVKPVRRYQMELQRTPATELRSNILNMLSSSETSMSTSANDASKIQDSEKSSYGSGYTDGSDAESGSGENWYVNSGEQAGSADPSEESSPNINTKRDIIAKSVILNVIRQAEKHLSGMPNDSPIEEKRKLIRNIIQGGNAASLQSKSIYVEESSGSPSEYSGLTSGSGQASGSDDVEGDNFLPYAKASRYERETGTKTFSKGKGKDSKETKNKIVKQLVKEMARAAIESVVEGDSHVVVKKSDIAEWADHTLAGDTDGAREMNKRSKYSERDIVNVANDKDIHTALKMLVNSLLTEGPSSTKDDGDLLRVKRMESEKKLENDMLATSRDPRNETIRGEKKSRVITDVKDFEGLAEELSQSDFLTPYKHDAIANKLEGDLVKNLKLTKEQSATIFKEEDNLLKATEMEYIKEKIDREFSRNDGASRKEKIAAIKKIIRSLPLSKEDSDDLTRTIKESNWLNVGSNSRKKKSHLKHKST